MSAGSSRDPRYDVVLRETYLADPAEGYQVDLAAGDLPLMLTEQGTLGYTVGLTSPYGGRLSQGDLQDADLSQYTSRTQRDWSGGRGQLESYAATNRYYDGRADARFAGRVTASLTVWQDNAASLIYTNPSTSTNATLATVRGVRFRTHGTRNYWVARGRDLFAGQGESNPAYVPNSNGSIVAARAATITDLAVFGDLLYIAMGDATAMDSMTTGNVFAAVAGREATYLCVYNGYLYTLTTTGVLEYFNGTTWSASIQVGRAGDEYFTGLVGYKDAIFIASDRGLYSMEADIPYTVYTWGDMRSTYNGAGMAAWVGDGRLYIPLQDSLVAYDGSTMQRVWMDEEEDAPEEYRGRISAILATQYHLFVAVDGGTDNYSAIYARTQQGAWHTIHRTYATGRRIANLWYWQTGATVPSTTNGLFQTFLGWHEQNFGGVFKPLTDTSNDIDDDLSIKWDTSVGGTSLTSSWIGSELRLINKEIKSAVIGWRPVGAGSVTTTLDVDIECDRTGQWLNLGTITANSGIADFQQTELQTTAPNWSSTVSSYTAATRALVVASASGLTAGQHIRIGREVRQVIGISSNTLTLNRVLDSAPTAGDYAYGSVPVAREFRYRLTFETANANQTIMVNSVSMKYQDQLIDRYRFTLQIRVEDGMKDNADGLYPYTAAQLRTRLYSQFRRGTPMRMVSPTGDLFTVKVANVNEAMFSEQKDGAVTQTKKSMMIASLIEV